ncbi:MAG: hypothetical protein AAF907_16255, partial [Planctomycetota bacterium]
EPGGDAFKRESWGWPLEYRSHSAFGTWFSPWLLATDVAISAGFATLAAAFARAWRIETLSAEAEDQSPDD